MASSLKLEKREASKTCRPPVFEENTVQVWLFTLLEHLGVISIEKGTEGTALSLTKRPMSVELADN